MPIGKNSINRVKNNGYSKVKSTAPDMENSVIAAVEKTEAPKTESVKTGRRKTVGTTVATEKKTASEKKTAHAEETVAAKKAGPTVKAEPKKKSAEVKLEVKEERSEVTEAGRKDSGYINIGTDMPVYLL